MPFLIGLDNYDRFCLTPDVVDNALAHKPTGQRFQCVRKHGHLFLEWDVTAYSSLALAAACAEDVFYTRPELVHLHQHFYHPSLRRFYDLLRRADPLDCHPTTLSALEEIVLKCPFCNTFGSRPTHFRVSLPPSPVQFNQEIEF